MNIPAGHPDIPAPKVGVLLINLGTPDAPTAPAVRRYLGEFLSDRRVVEIPPIVWQPILRGIILNTVNPGPVNTGYLDPESTDRPLEGILEYLRTMPFGRFGAPADPARLIAWLAGSDGRWMVGQVLTSDGGFGLGN